VNLTFNSESKPLTNEDIISLERDLGLTLPVQYKQFLSQHNGGNPSLPIFRYLNTYFEPHEWSDSVIKRFFGVTNKEDPYDIRRRRFIAEDRIPSSLLPIAGDAFGNTICVGIEGEWNGKVCLYHHEYEFEPEPGEPGASFDNVFPIADDFNTFLQSLQPMERDENDENISS
jgi:cell wall assembly regulator SMI1